MSYDWKQIDALRNHLPVPRIAVNFALDYESKRSTYDFNDRTRFKTPLRSVEILHLTDLQIGSRAFQKRRFVEYRDWILSRPNRFVLLGGDIIDAATVLSVASPYDNDAEPIFQVKHAVDILRPLADAGRLLGYVGGNHERRTLKTYGDVGLDIAEKLSVPYSRGVQLIDIKYGAWKPFKISMWHGMGGAATKGTLAQKLHRFMGKADSHVYFMGHHHMGMVLPDFRQERRGNGVKLQKIFGISGTSFQGYWNSYAETACLSPSDVMMGRVILEPDGKWEVTLR